MRNSRARSSPRSSVASRHHPVSSPRAGGRVARVAAPADGGTLLNAQAEVAGAARGDEEEGGAPLLLYDVADLLREHEIGEFGALAQFDPSSGAGAPEAPLKLLRSDRSATGYVGVLKVANVANKPYKATLPLGYFATAEEAARTFALAVRCVSEPHQQLSARADALERRLEVAERKLEIAMQYVPMQCRRAVLAEIADATAADATAADAAAAAAAADDDDDDGGTDGGTDAKLAKRQRKGKTGQRDVAKGIVRGADGKDPRVLKLSELRFVDSPTPPRELTTTVLEQYLFAAGVNKRDLDYAANKKNYAAHLIRLLESDQATEAQWSPTEHET